MKKIGELNALAGLFVLYYDPEDRNHYKLYKKWYDKGWHKKLIEKYANLSSCTDYIANFIYRHDEDKR